MILGRCRRQVEEEEEDDDMVSNDDDNDDSGVMRAFLLFMTIYIYILFPAPFHV